MSEIRSLKSRLDYLLTRAPGAYAWGLSKRPAADRDKQAFLRLVRPGQVIFDVGANVGIYSVLFSHLTGPDGQVHAFEPVPATFAALQARLARECRFGNVRANQLAVSSGPDSVEMFVPGADHGQASLRRHQAGSWRNAEAAAVTCAATTLDRYVDEHAISGVDLIKIDVEGAELSVLEGAPELLRRDRPALHLEISPDWTAAFGHTPADVVKHLARLGYSDAVLVGPGPQVSVDLSALERIQSSTNVILRVPER